MLFKKSKIPLMQSDTMIVANAIKAQKFAYMLISACAVEFLLVGD